MIVSHSGNKEIVNITLLENAANVEAVNDNDMTALVMASQHGQEEIVNTFVKHGW